MGSIKSGLRTRPKSTAPPSTKENINVVKLSKLADKKTKTLSLHQVYKKASKWQSLRNFNAVEMI